MDYSELDAALAPLAAKYGKVVIGERLKKLPGKRPGRRRKTVGEGPVLLAAARAELIEGKPVSRTRKAKMLAAAEEGEHNKEAAFQRGMRRNTEFDKSVREFARLSVIVLEMPWRAGLEALRVGPWDAGNEIAQILIQTFDERYSEISTMDPQTPLLKALSGNAGVRTNARRLLSDDDLQALIRRTCRGD